MKRPLVQIVAANAKAAREARGSPSYRELAGRAGLSPNTVRNLFEPEQRAATHRGDVSPRMDVVEKIAAALGLEAWQLLQERFSPADPPVRVLSQREADFYRRIREAYQGLDKSAPGGDSDDPPPRPPTRDDDPR